MHPGMVPPQPSGTPLPHSVSLHFVRGIQNGTHSSRRWISSGWVGPNWLFVKVCTVPKAEFFVL
jgi:hypothetical protein